MIFIGKSNSLGLENTKRLWQVNEIFQLYTLSAVIKAGLEIKGYEVGDPVHPLKLLDEEWYVNTKLNKFLKVC